MDYLSNQKQVYFLFSVLTESKEYDKSIIGLIVDAFIEENNKYMTSSQVCDKIRERSIKISERDIYEAAMKINVSELFENFNAEDEAIPFRILPEVYDDLANTTDLVEQLREYLRIYLGTKGIKSNELEDHVESIIDILLETIFSRNLSYLSGIITTKEARSAYDLMTTAEHGLKEKAYSSEVYHLYNDLLLNSDEAFDELLRNLIARFFRFLSLRYDIKAEEALDKRFGGSIFYLDSSYIIRLLGFDGVFRQKRAAELLTILRSIKDVKFELHASSLKETQVKVNELIANNRKVLKLPQKTSERLFSKGGYKSNNVLQIYHNLKKSGRVSGVEDFALYFSDVSKIINELMPNIHIDVQYFDTRKNTRQELLKALTLTDKSYLRIKHIVNLISYIDGLRGGNNFNVREVKVWLLTTDQETLHYDYLTTDENEGEKLTVCIMPSELLRMIDRSQGNVMGEHIKVYKQYMLKSHGYAQSYSAIEEEALVEIANIVERVKTVDPNKYDALYMIDNLFTKFTYDQIMKRYEEAKEKDKEIDTLIDLIMETNSHVIDNKYAKLYRWIYDGLYKAFKWIWYIIVYAIPFALLVSVFMHIVNWQNIPFHSMEDVFNKDALQNGWATWLKLVLGVFVPIAGKIYNRYSEIIAKYLTELVISKLPK